MRGFIILFCFAFSQAEKLGYNYGQGGSHNAFENRFRHRGNTVSHTSSSLATSSNNIHHGIGSGLDKGSNRYSSELIRSGIVSSPIEANYNKEFFSFSAPEEDFNDIAAVQRLATEMRKNLRVVFIKAPENNGLTNAALQLAKQSAESKTAIYVLTKDTDVADLVNQLQDIQQNTQSKPEVHFVKYRTPEDAIRAQQLIKEEYDTLDGTSRVSKEDVGAVLDFASKRDDISATNSVGNKNIVPIDNFATSINAYLPPKTRV